MSERGRDKLLQYLGEAHAMEAGLARVLQAQIMMTPRGSYRNGLETHLRETREHGQRVRRRMQELGFSREPWRFAIGLAETVLGQAVALGKTPLDLLRGSGGEEKVLKNAKDACATEALEIATYTAIERLAQDLDDEQTAKMAKSIRAQEERMLERVLREIPMLTGRVVQSEIEDRPSYDIRETGAADAAEKAVATAKEKAAQTVRRAESGSRRTGGGSHRSGGASHRSGGASHRSGGGSRRSAGESRQTARRARSSTARAGARQSGSNT